jgi:hypothetical protein
MSEPQRYQFRTIEDLHVVPLEKLEAFVIDLKAWLAIQRVAEARGGVFQTTSPRDCFEWIDDGKHDVNVTITLLPGKQ